MGDWKLGIGDRCDFLSASDLFAIGSVTTDRSFFKTFNR
jgi:hypothetical protein